MNQEKKPDANPNELRQALGHAIQYGTLSDLEHLFENGLNIDQEDFEGRTALQAMSFKGNREAVEMLLSRGADVNRIFLYQGRIPKTALDAAQEARRAKIVTILLEHGAKTGSELQRP